MIRTSKSETVCASADSTVSTRKRAVLYAGVTMLTSGLDVEMCMAQLQRFGTPVSKRRAHLIVPSREPGTRVAKSRENHGSYPSALEPLRKAQRIPGLEARAPADPRW